MRLLIATCQPYLDQFVGDAQLARLKDHIESVHHVDPKSLDAAKWKGLFETVRPDSIMTAWDTPMIPESAFPTLKYAAHLMGGIRHVVKREYIQQGLLVTNWGGAAAPTVAECALLMILSTLRCMTRWQLQMHVQKIWPTEERNLPKSLYGRRVGLHGFGKIARQLVKLLAPFDCQITAYSAGVPAEVFAEAGVAQAPSLERLFEEADVLVEVEALTPLTHGTVTGNILRRLRPGACFVNVGRGKVVDEAALCRIAQEGNVQIGLDVYQVEPLPPDSPLRGLPNVTLSPHLAGPTPDHYRECGKLAVDNLLRFAARQAPPGRITVEEFDRST